MIEHVFELVSNPLRDVEAATECLDSDWASHAGECGDTHFLGGCENSRHHSTAPRHLSPSFLGPVEAWIGHGCPSTGDMFPDLVLVHLGQLEWIQHSVGGGKDVTM